VILRSISRTSSIRRENSLPVHTRHLLKVFSHRRLSSVILNVTRWPTPPPPPPAGGGVHERRPVFHFCYYTRFRSTSTTRPGHPPFYFPFYQRPPEVSLRYTNLIAYKILVFSRFLLHTTTSQPKWLRPFALITTSWMNSFGSHFERLLRSFRTPSASR
jgi:hypothetical protein